jgi:hypothetical protein
MICNFVTGIDYMPIQEAGGIDDLRNVMEMFLGLQPVMRGSTRRKGPS